MVPNHLRRRASEGWFDRGPFATLAPLQGKPQARGKLLLGERSKIDYLIAPGLGGAEDIHNPWPESYQSSTWNARVKDDLEERLHEMVCTGQLDLTTAQRDIATDWIAAYKKYFRTDRPRS
jgi:hypothetical protein